MDPEAIIPHLAGARGFSKAVLRAAEAYEAASPSRRSVLTAVIPTYSCRDCCDAEDDRRVP